MFLFIGKGMKKNVNSHYQSVSIWGAKTPESLYKLKDEKQYRGLFFFHKFVTTFVSS
jgi:hypothetical protein